MNLDKLTRQYDMLKPLERIPLIAAAATRGDDGERNRLIQSAPRSCYSLPNHWGAATVFDTLANYHYIKLLDLAGHYLLELAEVSGRRRKKGDDPLAGWDFVLLLGYEFKTYLEGWQQFCAQLALKPSLLWEHLPGWDTILAATKLSGGEADGMPGAAFTAEGVARHRAQTAVGDPERKVDDETLKKYWPVTAGDIAADLREALDEQVKKWE
jgi:hypothetical protein